MAINRFLASKSHACYLDFLVLKSEDLARQVGNAALLCSEDHVRRVVEERLVQPKEVVQVLCHIIILD